VPVVPPDDSTLSFKLKAERPETLISGAASNLNDVGECPLCDGCQESTQKSKTLIPSSLRHLTYAAVYTCDPMISSISSGTLVVRSCGYNFYDGSEDFDAPSSRL
jgi:hypothetical protein